MRASRNLLLTSEEPRPESWDEILLRGGGAVTPQVLPRILFPSTPTFVNIITCKCN
jgi:hypothetical protein